MPAPKDPFPPRGPNPIGKYARWTAELITVQDRRFLRSLRIAHDVGGDVEHLEPPRKDDGKGKR